MKTVFVGLSGGVDSSVAALRLKNQGFNVVGVFIKVWHPDWMVCNWEEERLDAMRVAAHLDIPFLTCDAEEAYKQEVADYFIAAYQAGKTPNPDVMCNQSVKFGAFLRFAKEKGADYVATGHYTRKTVAEDGTQQLWRGVDTNKDQSYFLWTLTQEQLKQVLLPVGDTTKDKIREEAEAAGVPTASKKDSQGICFLGHIDIPEFLSHYTELVPGDVRNEAGETIGQHEGALVYTIGQRHGFTITNTDTEPKPHFVIAKDTTQNSITVSTERPFLESSALVTLLTPNLIAEIQPGDRIEAQFRYRQTPFAVTVKETGNEVVLAVVETTDTPAAGQSCVLYRGEECLGGGIIG
ncbi:MAG: tRNA 2-thiouridine(34) synthase MnmA [Patescibacteria group bacterium]